MRTTRQLTSDEHRGVFIEIAHPHGEAWKHSEYQTLYGWCGYISLWLDRFTDEELRESLWPDPVPLGIGTRMVLHHPHWLDAFDFHGGVTFFAKKLGSGDERGVKVGCDYRHLYDLDEEHDVESVLYDMKHIVDQLHEHTSYLMFCSGDGRLAPESEGMVPEGWQSWVSFAYMRESEDFQRHHNADGTLKEKP